MPPEFTITDRRGKKALWVSDGAPRWNIWDLSEKELTPSVKKAIINAYFIGAKHHAEAVSDVRISGQFNSEFTEKE
jgi:hypothetical protein